MGKDIMSGPSGGLGAAATTPAEIARFVVDAAVQAPSVNNTQPWWFSLGDLGISVHADPERQLPVADPDRREMMISCGAALFTARVALRYLGLVPDVRVLPDPDLPTLVARVAWAGQAPAAEYEQRLFAEIPRRHSHRGAFSPTPVPPALLAALHGEAAREDATLRLMGGGDQQGALAATVEAANYALRLDQARAQELAQWAPPPGSARRDGVPPTAYPAEPEPTEPRFPARDFAHGHGWGLPPAGPEQPSRSPGVAGVLTTTTDQPQDWIHAGQALQRVLLCAISSGVTAALHSEPLELPLLREFIRTQLTQDAYPQMVLRLGTTGQTAASVRRRVEDVLL